jgi:hypothetical protein
VEGNETDGPVLHFATGKMTVARLSMNALTYDFQFSGTLPDLRISYECRASGNNICMP